MATRQKQVVDSEKAASGFLDQQTAVFGVLAENAAQMAEVQKSWLGLATACAVNIVQSAMATQTEIARMSLDAMLHRDPLAMMSLGQRAARTGFRETMDCASRNLQAAQSLGVHVLDAVSTPAAAKAGKS